MILSQMGGVPAPAAVVSPAAHSPKTARAAPARATLTSHTAQQQPEQRHGDGDEEQVL